jgi:hypothetical protein
MWRIQVYGMCIAVICLLGLILAALDNRASLLYRAFSLAGLQFTYETQVLASAVLFGGVMIVCLAAPRIAFRRFIPARCPHCAGNAYLRVISPVRYICQSCGHCAATETWEAPGKS